MTSPPTLEQLEQSLSSQKDYFILEDAFEDADEKLQFLMKYQAIVEIRQASPQDRQTLMGKWAKKLEKSQKTLQRWLKKVDQEGLAALARQKRSDKGKLIGDKRWRKNKEEEWESKEVAVAYWTEFIETTYKKGQTASRRKSSHQVFVEVESHAKENLGLKKGEYPSRNIVYKVLEPFRPEKKPTIRRPCQGPDIVIRCYDKHSKDEKTYEEILVNRSNLVWQIDHTELNNLLVDIEGRQIGGLIISSIVDTYSGCVMGRYLGFDAAGSHEVALALRHAILPKLEAEKYDLQREWEVCGLPEYIVTDNAKEFHSAHLKRIASQFGIKLRYRAYIEQGGSVERPFKNFKTEVDALLPGYKGGNVQERPPNAEKWACMTFEDYDQIITRFIVDHQHYHPHPRQGDKTRLTVWKEGLEGEPKIPDERELDICLLKESGTRKIQAYGTFNLFNEVYQAGWGKDEEGLPLYTKTDNFLLNWVGKRVVLRYNPDNIVEVLVYTPELDGQPSQYVGKAQMRDRQEERLSQKELKTMRKKELEGRDNLDLSSIYQERLALTAFSDAKVSEKRSKKKKGKAKTRELRRQEQDRITSETRSTNVVPFPSEGKKSPSLQQERPPTQNDEVSYQQEPVESAPEPEIEASPALFVISDWDEFTESNW
ncbi:MAG: Mu transposase C-terminal domain-containing protein [Microcystaceae cyanobacterium]